MLITINEDISDQGIWIAGKKGPDMEKYLENGILYFAITIALIVIAAFLGFDGLVSVPGVILVFTASVMFILSLGYIASFFVKKSTGKDHTPAVMPITSIAISVISIIVGIIMYVNDHSFMNIMRGLEAELVWLLISVPAAVVAVVQFIVYVIRRPDRSGF